MPLAAVLATLFLALPVAHVTGLRNSLAVVVGVWALASLARERHFPPLAMAMAGWLVIGAASALWSADAEDTLKAVAYDIVLPASAFCGAYVVSRDALGYRILGGAVICSALVLAAFMLVAYWLGEVPAAARGEGSGGRFPYYPGAGVTSTLCVYALPFALLLQREAKRGACVLGWLGLGSIAFAGVAGDNRMFWPTALAVLAAFWAWEWKFLSIRQRIRAAAMLVAGALLAGAVFLELNATRGEPVAFVAQDNRPAAWREWAKIAGQAPVLGYGFGLKSIRAVGKEKLPADFAQDNREMQFHAHNMVLDIVLQVGVVGLVVFLLLLAALAREAWRARDEAHARVLGAALIALLAGMLTKNLTDDFMHHAVVIAFWGYAGVLVGRLSQARLAATADRYRSEALAADVTQS